MNINDIFNRHNVKIIGLGWDLGRNDLDLSDADYSVTIIKPGAPVTKIEDVRVVDFESFVKGYTKKRKFGKRWDYRFNSVVRGTLHFAEWLLQVEKLFKKGLSKKNLRTWLVLSETTRRELQFGRDIEYVDSITNESVLERLQHLLRLELNERPDLTVPAFAKFFSVKESDVLTKNLSAISEGWGHVPEALFINALLRSMYGTTPDGHLLFPSALLESKRYDASLAEMGFTWEGASATPSVFGAVAAALSAH